MSIPTFTGVTFDDLLELKPKTREVAEHFLSDANRQSDGVEILTCAKHVRVYETDDDQVFIDTFYCNHAHCPLCQKRRAKKQRRKFHQLLNQNPELLIGKWLFLTLTVRDCTVDDLPETVNMMVGGVERLSRRKFWKENVIGGIRFLEVTENEGDKEFVHPHFHCLLLVRPSMFEGNHYVSTAKWRKEWQNALQTYYEPRVNVRRLKGNRDEMRSEIVKRIGYSMKAREKILDRRRFLIITDQMRNRNRIQSFGIIRTLLSELNLQAKSESFEQFEKVRQYHKPSSLVWDWEAGKYRSN